MERGENNKDFEKCFIKIFISKLMKIRANIYPYKMLKNILCKCSLKVVSKTQSIFLICTKCILVFKDFKDVEPHEVEIF